MFKKGVRINWLIVVGAFFILLPTTFKFTMAKPDHVFAATVLMQDENFEETVLYMVHHTVDGAVAVVLNRPYPEEYKANLPPFLQKDGLAVFWGGPVGEADNVWIMKYDDAQKNLDIRPFGEWAVMQSDILGDVEKSPSKYRIFVGTAVWAPFQFELERMAGGWYFGVKRDVIFSIPPSQTDRMWREFMRETPQNHKTNISLRRMA